MIIELEKKLEEFKYISTKSEILIHLVSFYLFRKDFEKVDNLVEKFISTIDLESNILARSKLLHESIIILIQQYNFDDFHKIENLIDTLLTKIKSPYFKIVAWVKKLEFLLKYGEKLALLKEIKEIELEIQKILEVNNLILLKNILNPMKIDFPSERFVDQTSIDNINKKFASQLSKIAIKLLDENLFNIALNRVDLISLNLLREESLREIINNYCFLAIKTNDQKLALKINELSKKIKDRTCWSETLFNYSKFLKIQENFNEIENIINSLILIIQSTKGEFSRAVIFKEIIKIIQNLKDESKRIYYLNKIREFIDQFQSVFSSILIKIELIKTYYKLNKFMEGRDQFKEIILHSNLINNQHLFLKIIYQLIDLIPNLKNMINEDLISFFILKINNLKTFGQKTEIFSYLVEKIENLNLNDQIKKIWQIMAKFSKPYTKNNIFLTEHYFLFLRFSIKQAFKSNDKEIIENPLILVETAHSQVEKCLLILELINQFKKRKQVKQFNYYQNIFMKQFDNISNEFEKKEVLVKYLNIIK